MSQTEKSQKSHSSLKGLLIVLFLSLVILPLSPVLINRDGLKALIEAEATILGFFGVTVVYLLNSLDTRIDRFEQQQFELKMKQFEKEAIGIMSVRDDLRELKKAVMKTSVLLGSFQVASITISVGLLGYVDLVTEAIKNQSYPFLIQIIAFIGGISLMLFLESMYFIFDLFYLVSKKS